jgi:hypothetical protein
VRYCRKGTCVIIRNSERDYSRSQAEELGLSKRLGYFDEHDISNCESKIVEAEKVLGALLRSMRR